MIKKLNSEQPEGSVVDGPHARAEFQLDLSNQLLIRGSEEYPLRPKTFAVLRHLASHPGQLIRKSQLLDTVWPDSYVGEMVLRVSIRELRKVLGDDPRSPRYIQTIHGRGYRLIGHLAITARPSYQLSEPGPRFYGRREELNRLHTSLAKAFAGERQVVFVTGKAGIGKSALIETFLTQAIERHPTLAVARGQCQELHSREEDCSPVLEGLERLCGNAEQGRLVSLLDRFAPSWLAQMPSLNGETARGFKSSREALVRKPVLRELIVGLGPLTAEIPLVQVVEDLQWSDPATLDLLLALGQRREPARWLWIGSFRDPQTASQEQLEQAHQRLRMLKKCVDLPLSGLDLEAVAAYLAATLPVGQGQAALAEKLWRWTGGHPLWLESLARELLERGYLTCQAGRWRIDSRAEEVARRHRSFCS